METKSIKTPVFLAYFGCLWIVLEVRLEARAPAEQSP